MTAPNLPDGWLDVEQMLQSAPAREASGDTKFQWGVHQRSRWHSLYAIWAFSLLEARHEDRCARTHPSGRGQDKFRACFNAANPTLSALCDALWGVRCAYTHTDGDTDGLHNDTKLMALSAPGLLNDVHLDGTVLEVGPGYYLDVRNLLRAGWAHLP